MASCTTCEDWRWASDPDHEKPTEGLQQPPAPGNGLIPCPRCSPDGWDAPWPPLPAARPAPDIQMQSGG